MDRFLAAILCTFVLVNGCMAVDEHGGSGNGTGGGGVSDGSGNKDDSTGLEEGLEPLYDMTSNFLDVIQPKGRGYILEIMGIDGRYQIKYSKSGRPSLVTRLVKLCL